MKPDLYRTLEVLPNATDDEVKRAYRRLALLYHPDRNQNRPDAEERIKEANYAYSILGDSEKRKRYDLYREIINHSVRWGVPPTPAQERALKELILDPKFPDWGQWLDQLLKERGLDPKGSLFWAFSRTTLRTLRHLYEESRRQKYAGRGKSAFRFSTYPKTLFRKVGVTLNPFGFGRGGDDGNGTEPLSGEADAFPADGTSRKQAGDIEWTLPLSRQEAEQGTEVTLPFLQDARWHRLSLKVPPGLCEGMRLRVRNKGNRDPSSGEKGDLYLRVQIR